MYINELMRQQNMSAYRLSKDSGVPMTTIADICSGKASIERCAAGTLYKIAKTLGTTVEEIMEKDGHSTFMPSPYVPSFETFKDNVCHVVKDKGDIEFIIETLENDEIHNLYQQSRFAECLYTLAMVDYLSRENDIPLCTNYDDLRQQKLERPIYSEDVLLQSELTQSDQFKEEAEKNAIPEFARFNIMEGGIRDVI